MSFENILVSLGKFTARATALALRQAISFLIYAYQTYPNITTLTFLIIWFYFLYKFLRKIIRVWIRLIITTIKTVVTLSLISLVFMIYLRGYHRLVKQDWPYIKLLVKTWFTGESEGNDSGNWLVDAVKFVRNSNFESLFPRRTVVKEAFQDDYGQYSGSADYVDLDLDFDPSSYFEYAQNNFENAKDSFENAKDTTKEQIREMLQNLKISFGNRP